MERKVRVVVVVVGERDSIEDEDGGEGKKGGEGRRKEKGELGAIDTEL